MSFKCLLVSSSFLLLKAAAYDKCWDLSLYFCGSLLFQTSKFFRLRQRRRILITFKRWTTASSDFMNGLSFYPHKSHISLWWRHFTWLVTSFLWVWVFTVLHHLSFSKLIKMSQSIHGVLKTKILFSGSLQHMYSFSS